MRGPILQKASTDQARNLSACIFDVIIKDHLLSETLVAGDDASEIPRLGPEASSKDRERLARTGFDNIEQIALDSWENDLALALQGMMERQSALKWSTAQLQLQVGELNTNLKVTEDVNECMEARIHTSVEDPVKALSYATRFRLIASRTQPWPPKTRDNGSAHTAVYTITMGVMVGEYYWMGRLNSTTRIY